MSYNYLTEDSFRPDVFADMRTLETLNLQRNRFVLWYGRIKELTPSSKQKRGNHTVKKSCSVCKST